MERSTLPGNFLEALQAEECVLFVGSGISLWSGLPTWEGLLKRMVEFLNFHGASASELDEIGGMIDGGNLLSAASLCRLLMRPADFAGFIRDVFISSNLEPHEIHEIIVDLPPVALSRRTTTGC